MTETAETPTPNAEADSALAAIFAQCDARTRRLAEVRPANKAALFDALAAAGITTVVITFDGAGDSGQVESIETRRGDADVNLPDVQITVLDPKYDGSSIAETKLPVREAIEALAYDCLEETHGGWENNEGAFGEFTFDVAERTIALDYNERILESEHSHHEL